MHTCEGSGLLPPLLWRRRRPTHFHELLIEVGTTMITPVQCSFGTTDLVDPLKAATFTTPTACRAAQWRRDTVSNGQRRGMGVCRCIVPHSRRDER